MTTAQFVVESASKRSRAGVMNQVAPATVASTVVSNSDGATVLANLARMDSIRYSLAFRF
jgi:hypothetical protein